MEQWIADGKIPSLSSSTFMWIEEVDETQDKVFLLSYEDVYCAGTPGHGDVEGNIDTRYYPAHR